MSKVVLGLIEYSGKVAAASLVFAAMACCAGYFQVKSYLIELGAFWFSSSYPLVELGIRGTVYAAAVLLVAVIIMTVNHYRMIKVGHIRYVGLSIMLVMAIYFSWKLWKGELYQDGELKIMSNGWEVTLSIVLYTTMALRIFQSVNIDNVDRISVLSIVPILVCIGLIVVPVNVGKQRAVADRADGFPHQPLVRKNEGNQSYHLIASAGGKFLLLQNVVKGAAFLTVELDENWLVEPSF
ncbi:MULTISPECIES: hypothetical protein [unclassified Pseudomonas]|uniref:hypothetical protein n=1 Tax=unclassified Pseudomonas TaxID=196821 RepID=UPI0025FE43BF|nr:MULTISPECIES: hypothetical protein [unclassified Pseudomonas]